MLRAKEIVVMRAHTPVLSMFVMLFLVAVAIVPACSGNKRTRTLQATLTALNAARDGFVAWDLKHQKEIVAKATVRAEAEAAIEQYRSHRELVVLAFTAAYRAVAVAATEGDDKSLKAALETADELRKVLQALMGGG